jgi:hypothetical protein
MLKPIKAAKFRWQGCELFFGGREVGGVVRNPDNAFMWHVRMPGGSLSDPLNLTRTRHAAQAIAMAELSGARKPTEGRTAILAKAGAAA